MKNTNLKKLLSLFLSLIMILSALPLTAVEGSAQSKDEVPEGYKGIYTIEDLYCINDDMDGKYILMNDIDLTEATAEGGDWDFGGRGWNPIGSENIYSNTPFTGEFDGNDHSIIGMRINITSWPSGTGSQKYIGLFASIKGYVYNLHFIGANISVPEANYIYTGCLCGEINKDGHVRNVFIDNSSTNNINTSRNTTYRTYAGGVCGSNSGVLEVCSNCSNVSAVPNAVNDSNVGGICGLNKSGGIITNCYNIGTVNYNGNKNGGICGYSEVSKVITNCYNIGQAKYGICITNASNCYYLSGTGDGCTGATELTAAQMKFKSMYRGFDFENVWMMSNDVNYPYPVFIKHINVESVSFEENNVQVNLGETKALEYTVLPADAEDKSVIFSDYDPNVISVDENGIVTALNVGTTSITVTTTDRGRTDTCTVEVVCAHKHTTVYPQINSTCNSHGHAAYTVCNDCGEVISGDNTELPLLEHSNLSTTTVKEATCTEKGQEQTVCLDCGTVISTKEIPAKGHNSSAPVTENEFKATCTANGSYDSVVYCADCGEVLSRTTVIIPATGHKGASPVRENEKAETCTTDGYYDNVVYCSDCGAEISRTRVTIPAKGHTPSAAVRENEKAATCTADGYYDIVVYCSDCGAEISRTRTTITALGHDYGEVTYTWSADNSKCTATRVCSRDASHKETETVNSTSKVTKQATTTSEGEITYTATFSNSAFATQTKKVSTPKIEDNYKGFHDVKEGSWYYDAVQFCAQKGYISGYQNGNFGPNDNLKRQDFVVILSKIAGADLDKYAKMTPKLKDVKKGAYYAAAVNWAVDNNIIAGYANGNFGVNDNITREQVATILYRYMKSPEVKNVDSILKKFSDVNRISSFAKTAVAWAVQNNVISGMADGRVAPTEGAARAQIASIIMRMDQQGMFDKS